ncbi:hypothetical protein F5Y08DRAFT_311069 [Xylaria arbuscula]|nr:hypothetical protein F5Y08DRAFT_311069 [Xylaria arbuscula]
MVGYSNTNFLTIYFYGAMRMGWVRLQWMGSTYISTLPTTAGLCRYWPGTYFSDTLNLFFFPLTLSLYIFGAAVSFSFSLSTLLYLVAASSYYSLGGGDVTDTMRLGVLSMLCCFVFFCIRILGAPSHTPTLTL